jgi:molecular chaperone DnaK (HSP70)
VYDTLADFINTSVKSRASGLGLLNNNEWDLDSLLLVGGASRTPGVTEFLTRIFPRVPLVLPQDREFNVLKGLMVWVDNQEYSCQVKTMYPFNFYVERFDAAAQTAILEKIPFDLNNLRLEINKKYRIITFDRDTLYNLSPDPEFLNIRIYEGDAETPQLADQFSGRDLVLEVAAPRSALPDQISVYLDLSQGKLEISDGYKTAQSISKSNHWGRLNQRQWDCYDHLSKNNPNSLLMQDYRSQLQMLKEPKAQACSGYDRLTLYKIYALLDAVQKRK